MKYKTILAPNAPWLSPEQINPTPKAQKSGWRKRAIKIDTEGNFDYFAETREQINKLKTATKSRTRDSVTGRFQSVPKLAGSK
jgi:hypothetical protein